MNRELEINRSMVAELKFEIERYKHQYEEVSEY